MGQTLTVSTSGIADADGLTNATYGGTWTAGGFLRVLIAPGKDLSYTASRRDVGLTLEIGVNFEDDAGKRHILDSAATVAVAATSPAAPENFSVSQVSDGDLELSWQAPTWDLAGEISGDGTWGDGGSPITGYVVQWKKAADSWSTAADVSEATETGTSHTIEGLPDGQDYTVRVLAVNDVGRGAPSDEATATIDRPATSPDASLSALTLSGVDFGAFAPETTSYTAQVANSVTETTVTPTVNHAESSYVIKLGGVTDSDGMVTLSVGSNVITIKVTAEDDSTTLTYTVTVTREEAAVPAPADPCVTDLGTLTGTVTRTGSWANDCPSTNQTGGYARFYTFTLEQETEVTIELTSEEDTYLFLLEWADKSAEFTHKNDDIESSNTNSRNVETLAAGTYTIEATTYGAGVAGEFTLGVLP